MPPNPSLVNDGSLSFEGYNSHPSGPLLAGPMLGEVGETFARVWVQARDTSPLTLILHAPEGDVTRTLTPSPGEWLCGVFHVGSLAPGQSYEYTLSSDNGQTERHRLSTAPSACARRLTVAFGSCYFYYPSTSATISLGARQRQGIRGRSRSAGPAFSAGSWTPM